MGRKLLLTITVLVSSIFLFITLTGWKKNSLRVNNADIERSVSKSLLLLQKSGYTFTKKGRCASCHHNTLFSLAAEKAGYKGIPVVDSFTTQRIMGMENTLKYIGNNNLMNSFV